MTVKYLNYPGAVQDPRHMLDHIVNGWVAHRWSAQSRYMHVRRFSHTVLSVYVVSFAAERFAVTHL